MDLNTVWFMLIMVLFAGYFLLEGFDFGVGILAPIIGKDPAARNTIIRTIGPVWDGNEVWLIVAGGALFAAFPEWYATMFSGLYLPLFVVLVALIIRVVGLEWRKKVDDPRWMAWSDRAILFGSWVPPLMWGLIFANIVRGLPIKADHTVDASSTFTTLFSPYAILGAVAFTAIFALHGLAYIRLKTVGRVREDAAHVAPTVIGLAALTGTPFVVWTAIQFGHSWSWIVAVAIVVAVIGGAVSLLKSRDGISFFLTSLAVIGVVFLLFSSLFPNVMPTTLTDGTSLDIWNASSSDYTLRILTWTAAVVAPLVVVYQGWTYWVFRKRLRAEPEGAHVG